MYGSGVGWDGQAAPAITECSLGSIAYSATLSDIVSVGV